MGHISKWARIVAAALAAAVLASGGLGCGSAYHRTLRDFEPDPDRRLVRRIAEARHAQVTAAREYRAAAAELESLRRGPGAAIVAQRLAARYERLEPTDWDLRKRIASVHDVEQRLPEGSRDEHLLALLAVLDATSAASQAAIAQFERQMATPVEFGPADEGLAALGRAIQEAIAALEASRRQTDAFLSAERDQAPPPAEP